MCGVIVGSHVIAREEELLLRAVETDVVLGVARCVGHEPLAAGEAQRFAGFHGMRDHGNHRPSQPARHAPAHPHLEGRARVLPAPGRAVVPAVDHLPVGGVVLGRAQVVDRDVHVVARLHDTELEGTVRNDLGTRFFRETVRTAEVVGVRVGHQHRVHVLGGESGLAEALEHGVPAVLGREARIDDGGALVVQQGVHVDVAEPRHPDRKLHAEHVRGDLGDLGAGVLLFLAAGLFRHRGRVAASFAPGDAQSRLGTRSRPSRSGLAPDTFGPEPISQSVERVVDLGSQCLGRRDVVLEA